MVMPAKGDSDEAYQECFAELKALDEATVSVA